MLIGSTGLVKIFAGSNHWIIVIREFSLEVQQFSQLDEA
jgi:hypothetical protein